MTLVSVILSLQGKDSGVSVKNISTREDFELIDSEDTYKAAF